MIKNISAHAVALLSLYVNRSRTFVQTIHDKHFAIEIVYIGERKVAPEYSFVAASLIASSIASGHPGSYNVPCGELDLWHITMTPFTQLPPIQTNSTESPHTEKGTYGDETR